MAKPDDLSKPAVALDHDSTLVCVIEMSGTSWLVAATVPGVDLLRDNQNRSPSDNLPYIRWWSSVWRASWCQARSRQRREPEGLGFTAVCLPDIIIAGCSFRWMKLSSVSEA